MSGRKLTEAERRVLIFARDYGPGVDWGGRGASSALRKAAVSLIECGYLAGASYRNTSITPAGQAALTQGEAPNGE